MCTWRVFLRNSLPLLALVLLLAGCAATGAQAQPTGTAVAQTQPTPTPPPTPTPTDTPIPSCPANNIPTNGSINEPVIAPHGWKTFSDTQLHYRIGYPANWIVPIGPCPGMEFFVVNHIPIPSIGAPALPPGGFYIDVDPMPNPSQLSAADFSAVARPNMPGGPPCKAYVLHPVKVAGRDAVLATCPAGSDGFSEGDPNQGYTYFVPDGTTMLVIIQRDLVNGKPSPVLAEMVDSIVFTSQASVASLSSGDFAVDQGAGRDRGIAPLVGAEQF